MRASIFAAATAFFLLGIGVASANTSGLSTNPAYAAGPFSFYCAPYKTPFESGKHYQPEDGGCVFSVPNTIAGYKIISLYRGTQGNAALIAGDGVFSQASTLIQEDNVSFGTPTQDDDYFAVIWDYDLFGGTNNALGTYFSKGDPLPSGAVEGQNFYVLKWKWGAKPVSEFEPVVIIPGILGSWEKNDEWIIDPILHTYDNLIDTFLANGYVEGKTLFRFGYDWEAPNEVTAHLLANKISQIKQTCGCKKVDVIAHSMGGLVALYYVENSEYKDDIDQLFLVATPIAGAPFAYNTWEGGIITSSSTDLSQNISNNLKLRIFAREARDGGFRNIFEYIHNKPVVSVQELLPVLTNYLFTSPDLTQLTYPNGYPINGFVENILKNFRMAFQKVRIGMILADNGLNNTLTGFAIKPSIQAPKWEHGEPITTFFGSGDGTVPRSNIENFIEPAKEFDGVGHNEVASTSAPYIFKELNNRDVNILIGKKYDNSDIDYSLLISKLAPSAGDARAVAETLRDFISGTTDRVLSIILFSPINMQIIAPDGKRVGKDFSTGSTINEIPGAIYSGPTTDHEFLIIPNPLPGTYKVETIGTGNGPYTIATNFIDSATVSESQTAGTTTLNQIILNILTLSSTSTSLVITKDSPPTLLTTDSCITDIAKAYQNKWVKKNVYDGIVIDCKALKVLFKTKDDIEKIDPTKRTKAQKALLEATVFGIGLTLNHIALLAKDKDNTKESVELINKYILWFKNHQL
jgi:pimeloyl-ACP methyl ester carboxylesterase